MLVQHWGVGHAQVSWDLRQNPKIVDIFSKIWKVEPEDLLVSFDGLSFHLPPETTRRGWHRSTWLHTDQSYSRNYFECLQCWATALDVTDGDATLCFLEGSNNKHKEFAEHFELFDPEQELKQIKKNGADWFKLSADQKQWYQDEGCELTRIKCSKGSLVFWDSRTIHCGTEAIRGRASPNIRAVIYLCYMPKELCSKANLRKKQKASKELRTTNHWACKPKLFPKTPRTYGKPVPKITSLTEPKLTPLGMSLAGFDPEKEH